MSKGYTIKVTSWENDGDNYKTKSITVQSEDEAKAVSKMRKELFKSSNNGKGGIGNLMDDYRKARMVILDYVEKNPDILMGKKLSNSQIIDLVMDYNNNLMDGSEYYYSRVCEKVEVTYSPEDVYSQEVKF